MCGRFLMQKGTAFFSLSFKFSELRAVEARLQHSPLYILICSRKFVISHHDFYNFIVQFLFHHNSTQSIIYNQQMVRSRIKLMMARSTSGFLFVLSATSSLHSIGNFIDLIWQLPRFVRLATSSI